MKLLLVDDDPPFRQVMSNELKRLGYDTVMVASGEEAVRCAAELDPEVILLDLRLPGMNGIDALQVIHEKAPSAEVIMLTGHGSIDTAIESIRLGAFDYVVKPCPLDELHIRIQRAIERRTLKKRAHLLERGLTPADPGSGFLGESPEFCRLLRLIDLVAARESTTLITGETGVGKERAAKLIHARSPRRLKPFVIVDCASLQESLLQSELFGHERGAFTGAERAKPGLFEVADGGTIFLDEIGEVSAATQTKLLRVLDTSTFRRVGGSAEVHVDVRVLAATNRDLLAMVRQGRFREDLYYRLSIVSVPVPPLRARPGDVELLARHFVSMLNERYGTSKSIGASALQAIRAHSWPGNVRELKHVIESAMVVSEADEIEVHAPCSGSSARTLLTLEELEREHIRTALTAANGNRARTAQILGISERNLYRKLRDLSLEC